jgi:predicted ATP-dependent protease
MSRNRWEVPPEDLRVHFDLQNVPFATTAELPDLDAVIGQDRAMQAIAFGLHMRGPGYNLYVSGPPATGRQSIVKRIIQRLAEAQPTPDDWCYVYNFENPRSPRPMHLPAGKGREFQKDMADLLRNLEADLLLIFRTAEYQEQRRALEENISKSGAGLIKKLKRQAKASGFEVTTSRQGFSATILPGSPGRTLDESRPTDRQAPPHLSSRPKALDAAISTFFRQMRALDENATRTIEEFNRQITLGATEHSFAGLRQKYLDLPQVLEYLQAVQQDVLAQTDDFVNHQDASGHDTPRGIEPPRRALSHYAVSVLVDNTHIQGAPLVEEPNPTCANLLGCILRQAYYGTSYADFTLFRAGSLLRANGGYLLLNAYQLLRDPPAWEALKRAITRQEVTVEDIGDAHDGLAPSELNPEPIPMQTLVALLSALSTIPIDQGIALTGSVDQGGRLQAVSGVNEKIESFYAVCQALELTGTQGVIMPRQNLKHLMLHEDVVQAVASGRFHIYAASHVDEVLEILMQRTPGEQQPDGYYPAGSINAAVLNRLHEMHDRLQALDSVRRSRRNAGRPHT